MKNTFRNNQSAKYFTDIEFPAKLSSIVGEARAIEICQQQTKNSNRYQSLNYKNVLTITKRTKHILT